MSDYERWWITPKINSIHQYFRDQGYMVRTVYVDGLSDVSLRVGSPATGALAYFGHGTEPSLENSNSSGVKNAIYLDLRRAYMDKGVDADRARVLADQRCNNLNLDYVYMHTCHSLDNTTMRDYLVKPGGTYWGKEGVLWAPQGLTESVRP